MEVLAPDPVGASNVKKLTGQPGYRLRVGDWRVIYDIEQGRLVVRVLRVAPRGGVYE
jgi:mRNA interferase RelE/StbE